MSRSVDCVIIYHLLLLNLRFNISVIASRNIPLYPLLLQINVELATRNIPQDLGDQSARILLLLFRCNLISINCLHSDPIPFLYTFAVVYNVYNSDHFL
jgi:hypothetical protein